MSFIASFHAANPGCEITLVEGVPVRLSEMLLQGELDLAVTAPPEPFNEPLEGSPSCVGSIANTAIILPTSCVRWGWPCGSGSRASARIGSR